MWFSLTLSLLGACLSSILAHFADLYTGQPKISKLFALTNMVEISVVSGISYWSLAYPIQYWPNEIAFGQKGWESCSFVSGYIVFVSAMRKLRRKTRKISLPWREILIIPIIKESLRVGSLETALSLVFKCGNTTSDWLQLGSAEHIGFSHCTDVLQLISCLTSARCNNIHCSRLCALAWYIQQHLLPCWHQHQ